MAELIGAGYEAITAGLIFSVLPVGLFMLVQRHIVRGLMAGALK
jgi:ABC-type glycerol-3-phosphate transport system permease component